MIIIVTLNPLLEERLTFRNVLKGKVNRNSSFQMKPGGKGINVSRQLNLLGIDSFNFIFSGGSNGKIYRDILKRGNFSFNSIQTESDTRFASVIIEEEKKIITSYFSPDPEITSKECDEFLTKLDKMIRNCELVIFSGSSPKGAEEIIPAGIEIANKYDKVSVCDTYGSNLQSVFDASPIIIHNNFDELKDSLNLSLNDEQQIITCMNAFYKQGIKRSFITDAANPFYCSNFDYHFKVFPPAVSSLDSTGSGDSFLAGIIYGWHNNLIFEDSIKFATAIAAANSTKFEVSNVNPDEAKPLIDSVKIENVGKKIKIIDDSPH